MKRSKTTAMVMSLALVGSVAASSLYAENTSSGTRQGTITLNGQTVNYSSDWSQDANGHNRSATVNGSDGRSVTAGNKSQDGVRTSGVTAKGYNGTVTAGSDWNRETNSGRHGITVDGADGRGVTLGSSVNNGVRNSGVTVKGYNGTVTTGSDWNRQTRSGSHGVTVNGADGRSVNLNSSRVNDENGLTTSRSLTGSNGASLTRQSTWSRKGGSLNHSLSRSFNR